MHHLLSEDQNTSAKSLSLWYFQIQSFSDFLKCSAYIRAPRSDLEECGTLTGKSFYGLGQFPCFKATVCFWVIFLVLKKQFQEPKYKIHGKFINLQRCYGYRVSSLVWEAAGRTEICSEMLNTTWANLWQYIDDEQFLGKHGTAFNIRVWILWRGVRH